MSSICQLEVVVVRAARTLSQAPLSASGTFLFTSFQPFADSQVYFQKDKKKAEASKAERLRFFFFQFLELVLSGFQMQPPGCLPERRYRRISIYVSGRLRAIG
jgi:hypothetical protein